MAFNDMNTAELREALAKSAEFYGFDLPERQLKKNEALALLAEEGVTWKSYKTFLEPDVPEGVVTSDQVDALRPPDEDKVPEQPVPVVTDEKPVGVAVDSRQLILMTGDMRSVSIRGYKFTPEHPFHLVQPEDAQYILKKHPAGFRPAYPDEVADYYS